MQNRRRHQASRLSTESTRGAADVFRFRAGAWVFRATQVRMRSSFWAPFNCTWPRDSSYLLLDERSSQIFGDPIAERVGKLGGTTLRSIGHIARTQEIADNDADFVEPSDMIAELRYNFRPISTMRSAATAQRGWPQRS
jgi:hypothetical protein